MTTTRLAIICGAFGLLAGCAEEPPPRSVAEFLENRILLEATMVRCGENRNMSKYEAECVNAREAINRIAADEQRARSAELEAQSERKRKALRRTQEAAAEARRRAAEARRRREEAEYLGVFEDLPPGEQPEGTVQTGTDGEPGAVEQAREAEPQPDGQVGQDLESIREELRRRQDSN
ncbi:MAG: EexN family lipoprotein [Woeseiaceae bacterium]